VFGSLECYSRSFGSTLYQRGSRVPWYCKTASIQPSNDTTGRTQTLDRKENFPRKRVHVQLHSSPPWHNLFIHIFYCSNNNCTKWNRHTSSSVCAIIYFVLRSPWANAFIHIHTEYSKPSSRLTDCLPDHRLCLCHWTTDTAIPQ
jgi:hypothetical protein